MAMLKIFVDGGFNAFGCADVGSSELSIPRQSFVNAIHSGSAILTGHDQ